MGFSGWGGWKPHQPTHAKVRMIDYMKKEVVGAIVSREVEHRSDQFGKERAKLNERLKEVHERCSKAAAMLQCINEIDAKGELTQEKDARRALEVELIEAKKENLQLRMAPRMSRSRRCSSAPTSLM